MTQVQAKSQRQWLEAFELEIMGVQDPRHWTPEQGIRLTRVYADEKLISYARKLTEQKSPGLVAEFFVHAIVLPEKLAFVFSESNKSELNLYKRLERGADNFLRLIKTHSEEVTSFLYPAPSSVPNPLDAGERKYQQLVEYLTVIREGAQYFYGMIERVKVPPLPREHKDEKAMTRAYVRELTRHAKESFGKECRPMVARLCMICLSLTDEPTSVEIKDILKRQK